MFQLKLHIILNILCTQLRAVLKDRQVLFWKNLGRYFGGLYTILYGTIIHFPGTKTGNRPVDEFDSCH